MPLFHPLVITVATAEIQFENYVLSRGGTRLIRKVLVANNGCKSPCQSDPVSYTHLTLPTIYTV